MYILPRNDKEFEDLCDTEQFKGRHNVIMTIKEYLTENDVLSLSDFADMISYYNKRGWKSFC